MAEYFVIGCTVNFPKSEVGLFCTCWTLVLLQNIIYSFHSYTFAHDQTDICVHGLGILVEFRYGLSGWATHSGCHSPLRLVRRGPAEEKPRQQDCLNGGHQQPTILHICTNFPNICQVRNCIPFLLISKNILLYWQGKCITELALMITLSCSKQNY